MQDSRIGRSLMWTGLKHLISSERLPFTASYVLTMALTLYAAMGVRSYILTVIAAGLQCAALTYFTLSYIPGGQAALKFMAKVFYAIFSRCFKSAINVWTDRLYFCFKIKLRGGSNYTGRVPIFPETECWYLVTFFYWNSRAKKLSFFFVSEEPSLHPLMILTDKNHQGFVSFLSIISFLYRIYIYIYRLVHY